MISIFWTNQEGTDLGQRWYFSFDEGLDDQGQIALANWIIANLTGPLYTGHTRETASVTISIFIRIDGVIPTIPICNNPVSHRL